MICLFLGLNTPHFLKAYTYRSTNIVLKFMKLIFRIYIMEELKNLQKESLFKLTLFSTLLILKKIKFIHQTQFPPN